MDSKKRRRNAKRQVILTYERAYKLALEQSLSQSSPRHEMSDTDVDAWMYVDVKGVPGLQAVQSKHLHMTDEAEIYAVDVNAAFQEIMSQADSRAPVLKLHGKPPVPPRWPERILGAITPAKRRDDVLVTMLDRFEEHFLEHGEEFARRAYRRDVKLSFVTLLLDWVKRILGIAALLRELGLL